ncbi:MAG: choice-of-anchor tandem repeat GloVer-containing protein [Candidatus Sulfotelmatobacter sp.]
MTDGAYPQVGLVEGSTGILYGATYFGGSQFDGTIFSLPLGLPPAPPHEKHPSSREAQSSFGFDVRKPETAIPNASNHMAPLIATVPAAGARNAASLRPNTASVTANSHAALHAAGSEALTNISNFDGANGAFPYYVSLAQGTDGNLYGTTWSGGPSEQGTVFQVTTAGTLTTLYTFCSQTNCADGAEPFSGVMQATNGNFYGTTSQGGANGGGGTIFEVAGGQLTTLYSFCSQPGCSDGNYSQAPLLQASNGNLYGTTASGGANGVGNVFEITLAGQLTSLYSFCSQPGCTDGSTPYAGLVQAANGNLYGTTLEGGANGYGTIFEITPAGQLTTLYSFCSQTDCTDGLQPSAGLVQGSDGNFYGTTYGGGANGTGTIFEITLAGQLTTLYSFCSQTNCADGSFPLAGLVQVGGNFYGTTVGGGSDYGTVFEITSAGQLTTLYTFSLIDGGLPEGGLVQASNGNLYGLTLFGGNRLSGTVFTLPPVILLNPPSGTAQVGVAYSSSLVASGGVTPYTFSITIGVLPPGLSLNSSTGAVTGTPTTAGTYNFTAQVTDSRGNTATAGSSIVVSPALTLSGPTGTAQVGVAYNSVLNASGGVTPYTFSIIVGSLPPGLTLNASTGAITGVPTTTGTYNFTAQVVDSGGNTATANCTIVVTGAGTEATATALTLEPASVPAGSVGPIVMTATVTTVSGTGTPTGSVTYFNGSSQVGTATLTGGVGTFDYNPSSLSFGIYSITAVYSGNGTFSGSTSPAQTLAITQTGPFAYVANNSSNSVSVINIPTGQVTNNIPVGSGPWGTAVSPDQTQVYVTDNEANNVSVINAVSGSVVAAIPVQSSPFGVAFAPDGSSVYVANGGSNNVSVINPSTQTVVATIPVQNSPLAVAMAPTSNGTFAYVTNSGSDTVSVIAVASNTVVQTISVGTRPRWVTVSPNSAWAYVENAGSNNVSAISVATNQVVATIQVGTSPSGADVTPDNSAVYVANSGSNNVSVIDTQSNTVISTVPGFNNPSQIALTTDGASAYISNPNTNAISVIATASNTLTGTIQVSGGPTGVAIASAPQVTLQITQPLNPTQQNTFNFGANSYAVQYPPDTQFAGVNMTVTAVEMTQAQFQQRVAGTAFANASCIVYAGAAGNCIDDEVTCSDNSGNPISCPGESQPTIAVQTNFSASQQIINPGYLTTPIGQNTWQNIFSGYSDPTIRGKTQGFSEFVAVDLGATNKQGAAHVAMLTPKLPKKYQHGESIPIEFQLISVANGQPVTDAEGGLCVVLVADQKVIFAETNAFKNEGLGRYKYDLDTTKYPPGTYTLTIYGNAFAALQGQFEILH